MVYERREKLARVTDGLTVQQGEKKEAIVPIRRKWWEKKGDAQRCSRA